MASLILLKTPDGSASGEKYKLDAAPVLIGRSPEECQVILPPNAVSRKHAQITQEQGNYYIEDLKSRNKTFVNNKEINARTPLRDGDGIKICDFLFCFREESRPKKPVEPEPEPNTSTVEATFKREHNLNFLEAQPVDKLRAIIDISSALSKTLDVQSLMPQIADQLMSLFRQADRCFIIQYDETDNRLIPVVTKMRLQNHVGGDRFSRTIVRRCLETLQSFLSSDAPNDAALGGLGTSIAEFRILSVMCVPLVSQDNKPLGVIQLDSQDQRKKFTSEDLKLLVCVANQASIAIENARMHEVLVLKNKVEEENRAATKVQRGFLPQRFPDITGYEFFSHYLAARTVGGDYYDFICLPNGQIAVLLGDVSGKGVPAALLMARVSGEARVCIMTEPDVGSAITRLNQQLMVANLEDRYITLAATVLDPARNTVTIVNAGHITPAIYRQSTRTLEKCVPDDISGFPCGWVDGFEYQTITVELNAWDTLILFTDGILDAEAASGDRFGEEGVLRVLNSYKGEDPMSPRMIGERIIRAVQAHAANHPQFDDIALVCYGRIDARSTTVLPPNELEL